MRYTLSLILCIACLRSIAQTEAHNTIFMFNKLYYNPAYAGNKDVSTISGWYRNQWSGIKGAPVTYGLNADLSLKSRNQDFRQFGLGITAASEQIGVEKKQDIFGNYAFKFEMDDRRTVLAFGLRVGAQLYSANYDELNPYQSGDPNLAYNINSSVLFNFGGGAFLHNDDYYIGLSIPNMIENYYDKKEKAIHNKRARQVRGYYLTAGYVFRSGDDVEIIPQTMIRYAGSAMYKLPISADLNITCVAYHRMLFGITYRTDKSLNVMAGMQIANNINLAYSYDYLISHLATYDKGTHEVIIGFDFGRRKLQNSNYFNSNYENKVQYVRAF